MTQLRVGEKLVPLAVAATAPARARGLLGADAIVGALLLTPATSVHTLGMRFAIDVAHLDRQWRVLRTTTMAPNRIGRPVFRARHVLEANAGAFSAWGLVAGQTIDIVDNQVEPAA